MQWTNRRESSNVEDQRGMNPIMPIGGVGTLLLAAAIYFLGGDPRVVLNQAPTRSGPATSVSRDGSGASSGQSDSAKKFVSVVLADTEDTWGKLFQRDGLRYRNPKLVLFTGQVRSACGVAGSSTGPFYCPADEKLYLDTSFFQELKSRYGAPGDFAAAYVIAHEVGHHVQNQLGLTRKVQNLEQRSSKAQANQLSVRLELQADYYAGVWAHYAQKEGILDPGDIDEALTAASAVGDDKLQQESRGYVVPDSFTHGTSQQRAQWFRRGFESGDPGKGNTFTRDFQ